MWARTTVTLTFSSVFVSFLKFKFLCPIKGLFAGNSYFKSMKPKTVMFLINSLERKFRRDENNWQVKLVVREWHSPFIRAIFIPGNISVDVGFNNGLPVQNALMLRHLFEIQPEAAKFCLFMKKWLKMNEVPVKNSNVVLLVIFYLQQLNFLPSIQEVQDGLDELFIDGKNR